MSDFDTKPPLKITAFLEDHHMDSETKENSKETQKDTASSPQYFSVSTPKFVLMSVCTFGLYELYWFYKNWEHIKQLENSKIWPFWRAVFAKFNAYFLFKRVRKQAQNLKISIALTAGPLAILYLLLAGTWRLPDPYWLVCYMTFAPLLVANDAMSVINKRTLIDFQQNSRISGWNWLAVLLVGPATILGVISFLFFYGSLTTQYIS